MALLEIDDVVVRFGGVTAVDHASFGVHEGRLQGLIGPNGAGKTTIFNVINGLQDPDRGVVRFDGEEITRASLHERARRGLARTFQRLEVFGSLSVADNILVAAEIHAGWSGTATDPHETAERIIDRVGVADFAGERADTVPTGIARLTELGRALAIRPRMLLLDEPSSGLNEEETATFGRLLQRLAAEGMGILMVEHDVDLVMEVCEWIDVLDFGEIIAGGPPRDVQQDEAVQAAYLGADVGGDGNAHRGVPA